jgi:hypothetical protein
MATSKKITSSQEIHMKDMSLADLRTSLATAQREQYILHMRHTL